MPFIKKNIYIFTNIGIRPYSLYAFQVSFICNLRFQYFQKVQIITNQFNNIKQ
jgi:hypothetical protein